MEQSSSDAEDVETTDAHKSGLHRPDNAWKAEATARLASSREDIPVVVDPDCPPNTMYYVEQHKIIQDGKQFLTSDTGGRKEVKLARHSLIPPEALTVLAEIYGRGAAKYEDRNWEKGYNFSASYDALQRHLQAFWGGQDTDPESGQPHIMHAAWHCFALFIFSTDPTYSDFDDRAPRQET